MDEDECPHGLGLRAACVLCNGRARAEEKAAEEENERRTFEARYPGHCKECGYPILVGEMISWAQGEPVLHAECYIGAYDGS